MGHSDGKEPQTGKRISARGLDDRALHEALLAHVRTGIRSVTIEDVLGHRYIGTGIPCSCEITVFGVPGEDLGAFMDGPNIRVFGNAQNAIGNTMSSGAIAIHGSAGDLVGHSMRGGVIWVQGDVGYRVGIHIKSNQDATGPVIVIGGSAADFLGEYMAGGTIIVLGLNDSSRTRIVGNWLGTGMHGGAIYVRGQVPDYRVGTGAGKVKCQDCDLCLLRSLLAPYCIEFEHDLEKVMDADFTKLVPLTSRPYQRHYAGAVGLC